ncbi:hypothetical protein L210DRAFT_863681, partial [Boletus edulis BED1]
LTYSASDCTLIMEMLCSIHKMPLTDFRDCVCDALYSLPYNKYMLCVKIEMNLPFQSPTDGFIVTADLIVFLSSLASLETPEIPILIECSFSQDCTNLWNKMKKEINAHLEVVLLVAIVITELPGYCSPEEDSEAWKQFIQENMCHNTKSFLGLKDHCTATEAQSLCIKVAGHVWCNVASADWFVRVKDGIDHKINIDCMHKMHGTLFPSIEMEEVTEMVTLGLSKARDAIVSFSWSLNPSTSMMELENTTISFSVDWKLIQLSLVSTAGLTAHDQYQKWYQQQFHGQKCPHPSDEEYKASGSDLGSDVSSTRPFLTCTVTMPVCTHSKKAAR